MPFSSWNTCQLEPWNWAYTFRQNSYSETAERLVGQATMFGEDKDLRITGIHVHISQLFGLAKPGLNAHN